MLISFSSALPEPLQATVVGANRSRTDAESFGGAVVWERILGTGARLALKHRQIDIADDLIGQAEPMLRRDGTDTTLGLGYSWDLAAGGVVSVDLSHIWLNRDGAGNKGCAYLAEIKHVLGVGRLTFLTHGAIEKVAISIRRTNGGNTKNRPVFITEGRGKGDHFRETVSCLFALFIECRMNAIKMRVLQFNMLFSGAGIGYRF